MEHKEIIEESIKSHQAAIDKAKAELAKLDEPKLRHGDYGISGRGRPVVHIGNGLKSIAWFGNEDVRESGKIQDGLHEQPVLGNIFDDLERNKEDLTEFKVKAGDYPHCRGKELHIGLATDPSDVVYFKWRKWHTASVSLESATEIHQKLGQLISTAKRNANK